MFERRSLKDLRNTFRQDFIDYASFLGVASSIVSTPTLSSSSKAILNYESLHALKETLRNSLSHRLDKHELMGLSAAQVGIPAHAIYLEYYFEGEIKNVMLTDPEIVPSKDKNRELFLKLIKCPNSPSPYHIGLFNRSVIIKSSNNKDFAISTDDTHIDKDGNLSANLQRIVWADRGFIPGDSEEIPMNYLNICKTMEDSTKLQEAFRCWIRRDEIPVILEKYNLVDDYGSHRNGTRAIHHNFLELMTSNMDEEWIKVPPINMFKENDNFSLN
tara:strand:- start:1140 stop:1958 length:819 start_codon:yes stop_codon:yes gene_type:complete